MNLQRYNIVLIMFLFMSCQKTSGQEEGGGDVKFIKDSEIIFYDTGFYYLVKVDGVIRVTFTDSTSLNPANTNIIIFRMKGEESSSGSSSINFCYFYSRENELNDFETLLLNKYSAKLDSMFTNGAYQFRGEKKWIIGNKLDFSYSFKILPK